MTDTPTAPHRLRPMAPEAPAGVVTPGTLVREVAASGMAAAMAGLVAGGVGGRIVMRISALLNPDMHGRISENGNRIGEITAGGTIALVIFAGLLAGILVAWTWVAIRPWLPIRPALRYPAAAVAAISLTGLVAVEADNFDFFILDPAWAHVVMFTAIVAAAGVLTAWFDAHLTARWAPLGDFTVGASIIVVLGAALSIPAFGLYFSEEFCGCGSPPRFTGAFLVVALAATAASWVVRVAGRRRVTWIRRIGLVAVAGAIGTGLVHLGGQIAAIV